MPAKTDTQISKAMLVLLEELERSPLDLAAVARLSDEGIGGLLEAWHRLRAAADGAIVQLQGEANRREVFRRDGASNAREWQLARFGVSRATARTYNRIGDKAMDLPEMTRALSTGDISLDKMRILAPVASPETDRRYTAEARRCTVHELEQLIRAERRPTNGGDRKSEKTGSLRFNDHVRTMTLQLPPAEYAETKACIVAQAKVMPTDGETPWDRRCCDAFLSLLRSVGHLRNTGAGRPGTPGRPGREGGKGQHSGPGAGRRKGNGNARQGEPATNTEGVGGNGVPLPPSPFLIVLHAPLSALFDDPDQPSQLAGDLEHGGLISLETVRRLLCDSAFVIAVDDDAGHTMYEGRQRRSPTGAQRREIWRRDRCCRYPGCEHALFAEPHHLELWSKGGRTDLPNLALLCKHHHHLVHSNGWSVSGNANGVLTFVGPDGRTTESRPSPMWTAMIGPATAG